MDGLRFDSLTRALSARLTRRRGAGIALGALLAGGIGASGADATVKRRTCRPVAAACLRSADCCSGACDTRRSTPRNKRNRCVCVPDCTGKTCGFDGCSGFCGTEGSYGCLSGETCGEDGVTCTTGCSNYDQAAHNNWSCEASTEYETFIISRAWDIFPEQCDGKADCYMFGMCDKSGYACYCERAWYSGEYGFYDSEQGWCYYVRTKADPCAGGPFTAPRINCVETIEGETHFYVEAVDSWAGAGQFCKSDAECIALDSECNDPAFRCVCGLEHDATCRKLVINEN